MRLTRATRRSEEWQMILIVDDYEAGATPLCMMLQRRGFPCEWVSSGHEALARIRAHPREQPLLVVMDFMMPGASGTDVLKEIRADPRIAATTVMFHSAGFDLAKREEALMNGAVAWVLKGSDVQGEMNSIVEWYQ